MKHEMKGLIAHYKRMSDDPQGFEYEDLKWWLSRNGFLNRNVWHPRAEVLRLAEVIVTQNESVWQAERLRFQEMMAALVDAEIISECSVPGVHDIYPGESVCQRQADGCAVRLGWVHPSTFREIERFGHALMDRVGPKSPGRRLPDLAEERKILDSVNFGPLTEAVSVPYAGRGPRPLDRTAIVRAYFMAYLHRNPIKAITVLHWTLLNNPAFRTACRFSGKVPSRPTLSRVFSRIAEHPELVERIMDEIVEKARRIRPDMRREIGVDVTLLGRSFEYRGMVVGNVA